MATLKDIKDSLMQQLRAKGADVTLYRAIIDDYLWFFRQEKEMQADIRKRGRIYTAVSSVGKEYEKENPSVKSAVLYSRQMVMILDALGLDTGTVVGGTADDENDL